MQLLNQSAFLQSLGWAIANSLWQMAALWLFYQLFIAVNKRATASLKNIVATFLLFAGSIWFLYGLVSKYLLLQNEVVLVLQGDKLQNQAAWQSLTSSTNSFYTFLNTSLSTIEKYLPYLSAAYLMVLGFLFMRLLYAWNQSRIIKTRGLSIIEQSWAEHFIQLVEQAGIKKKVALWLSEKIDVPATLGFIKPIVLLPIASINQLTTEQVETILLHELGHIKRNDYLVNLFVAIAETILFFNPFAVLLATHLKKERENSCDDFVLSFRNQPETYAKALLVLEQNRIQSLPLLLKATGNDGQLLHRVKRIMNIPVKQFNYSQRLLAFLVTAAILSSLAWVKPVSKQQQSAKKTIENTGIASSLNSNKIVLAPSIIEKRKSGDIVLFDAQKKNSLVVKIEKDKVKLIDELNNTELLADELDLDKLKAMSDEETAVINEPNLFTPAPAPEMEAAVMNSKGFEQFKKITPVEFPKIRIPVYAIKATMNRKTQSYEMKKAMEALKSVDITKEWENLPTKEDWEKMQQEINNEMSKLHLQVQLNNLELMQLDSALNFAKIFSSNQRVNFDAAREKRKLQLRSLVKLRELSKGSKYIIINNDNDEMDTKGWVNENINEDAMTDDKELKCTEAKKEIHQYKISSPQIIRISPQRKAVKRSKVIVSL